MRLMIHTSVKVLVLHIPLWQIIALLNVSHNVQQIRIYTNKEIIALSHAQLDYLLTQVLELDNVKVFVQMIFTLNLNLKDVFLNASPDTIEEIQHFLLVRLDACQELMQIMRPDIVKPAVQRLLWQTH
jgi:hypothetical protein